MENKPLARNKDLVLQQTEDELLVYDLKTNKACCLNKASAIIWKQCDGTKSVSDISIAAGQKLNTRISEKFVWLALMQLQKNGLIEQNEPLVGAINSLNRRDLIKRVGFASAIALPLISSVVAPSAINAMSCTGPGTLPMGTVIQTCRGAAQCTAEAALFCCSGTATHTVIVCGAPGWGPCVCN